MVSGIFCAADAYVSYRLIDDGRAADRLQRYTFRTAERLWLFGPPPAGVTLGRRRQTRNESKRCIGSHECAAQIAECGVLWVVRG